MMLDRCMFSPTRPLPHAVMPGLVPGISIGQARRKGVDGRNKSGHDEKKTRRKTCELRDRDTRLVYSARSNIKHDPYRYSSFSADASFP